MIVILNLTNDDRGVDDEIYKTFNPFLVWLLAEWIYPGEIPGNLSAPLQGFTWFIWSLSKQIIPTESSLNIALDSIRLRVNGITPTLSLIELIEA